MRLQKRRQRLTQLSDNGNGKEERSSTELYSGINELTQGKMSLTFEEMKCRLPKPAFHRLKRKYSKIESTEN